MNTPQELQRIFDRLPKEKVELEKVELGILDNLQKYTKGLNKYQSEGDGLVQRSERIKAELKETQDAIYKWSDVGESIANDLASDLTKFKKAAKDLGVAPNSVKEFVNASDAFKTYAKLDQKYQQIAKNLIK